MLSELNWEKEALVCVCVCVEKLVRLLWVGVLPLVVFKQHFV